MKYVLIFFLSAVAFSAPTPLKNVKVGFLEALSPTDSTSSERYRRAFESAIFFTLGENERELNKCGYKVEIVPSYYDSGDREAPAKAGQVLQDKDAWIIFGPRRSEDFLGALPSLNGTPMISPMANSYAIYELKPPYFTMFPSVEVFAKEAVKVLKKENYGATYGVFLDATSPSAHDFSSSFDNIAPSNGFKKVFSLEAASDNPDVTDLIKTLSEHPVQFLILPNNSKFSGFTISKLQDRFPRLKYFGTHGWGDNHYGFLLKYGVDKNTAAMCIRPGRDFAVMNTAYGVRSLDYDWKGENVEPNFTAFSTITFIRQLKKDLCSLRPSSKKEFTKVIASFKKDHFRMKEPFSLYELRHGKLQYSYEIKN